MIKKLICILLATASVVLLISCSNENITESNTETTVANKTAPNSVVANSPTVSPTTETAERTTHIPTLEPPTTQKKTTLQTTNQDSTLTPNQEYQKEQNGMLLTVSLPKSIEYGEEFILVAKITNTTEESITYTLPTGTPDMHYEIRTKITDGKDFFTDRDTFFKVCDTMERNATLNPGETFEQTMHFIPGLTKNGHLGLDNADIIMFKRSTYNGTAEFRWNTDSGTESLVLEFPVIIK